MTAKVAGRHHSMAQREACGRGGQTGGHRQGGRAGAQLQQSETESLVPPGCACLSPPCTHAWARTNAQPKAEAPKHKLMGCPSDGPQEHAAWAARAGPAAVVMVVAASSALAHRMLPAIRSTFQVVVPELVAQLPRRDGAPCTGAGRRGRARLHRWLAHELLLSDCCETWRTPARLGAVGNSKPASPSL